MASVRDYQLQCQVANRNVPPETTNNLQSSTTSTSLSSSAISWNWSHILNATDLHASTSEGSQRSLGTGAGRLRLGSTDGSELNVEGGDTELLATSSDVLSGKHRSVRRRLVSVGLNLHSSSDSDDSLSSRQVSDVDEGVVETREDVSSSESLS